uniref:polynucleotide adenylyltransferase n=1 Tax=Fundulus heteroclitus TaxID=8078 RepID=A0A3Q2QC34_FUNHE
MLLLLGFFVFLCLLSFNFLNAERLSPYEWKPPPYASPAAPPPAANVPGGRNSQMVELFDACQQQPADLNRKEACRARLQQDIQHMFPAARLYLTGSSMNGLGCRSSDADLCLVIKGNCQHCETWPWLQRHMVDMPFCTYVERIQLIRAKVPILKFRERGSYLEFDLNINNTVGIRNTFLLRSYAYGGALNNKCGDLVCCSWDKQVISVREATTLPKTNSQEWRNKFICVEEPFERNNVARAVHEKAKFDAIKAQFAEVAWHRSPSPVPQRCTAQVILLRCKMMCHLVFSSDLLSCKT